MARLSLLCLLALLGGCALTPFSNDDDSAGDDLSDDDDVANDDDTTGDDDDSADDDDDDDDTGDDDDATGDDDDSTGDDDDSTGDDDDSTEPQLAFIYAHTSTQLYTVDPTTFATNLVGTFTGQNPLFPEITDIAVDPLGNMYAIGFYDLYTVDPTTAALTHLGTYPDFTQANAATCLPDGSLIVGAGGSLYDSSTTTASRTLLGTVGGGWLFAGDTVGLPDGLLYNLMAQSTPTNPTSLLTVDASTLATNVLGATGTGAMFGLAYHSVNGLVYGFTEAGDIYTLDPTSGAATLGASTGIAFWGATTNPARWQ